MTFGSSEEFDRYCLIMQLSFIHMATLEVVVDYNQLVPGRIYVADECGYSTPFTRRHGQEIEAAIFQREAALAVQRSVGARHVTQSDAWCQLHEKYYACNAIVIHVCDATKTSTAYIVECALSPQPAQVAELLEKVEIFKVSAATSSRFKAVTKFVPVLGADRFCEETISECIAHNVSRVASSGAGFEWIRCKVFDPAESDDLRVKELQLGADEVALRVEPTCTCMIYRLCRLRPCRVQSSCYAFLYFRCLTYLIFLRSLFSIGIAKHLAQNRPLRRSSVERVGQARHQFCDV